MAHAHGHHHAPRDFNRAFAIGVGLNVTFVVVEALYGVLSGSLALIADAGHNFSDVLGLLLAWGASVLAARNPTNRHTYGFRRATILASLASAILLLVALGGIAWEALARFETPRPVGGVTLVVVAGVGVVVNAATALMFIAGKDHDLNLRGAYLHMAADAGVSLGVVVAGVALIFTGWLWLDPAISLVIVVVILVATWGLLRDSVALALDAVPRSIDPERVRGYLAGVDGVTDVHDLHIWAMSTTETALTAHLVVPKGGLDDGGLLEIAHQLEHRFAIHHPTIQIERGVACTCPLSGGSR